MDLFKKKKRKKTMLKVRKLSAGFYRPHRGTIQCYYKNMVLKDEQETVNLLM